MSVRLRSCFCETGTGPVGSSPREVAKQRIGHSFAAQQLGPAGGTYICQQKLTSHFTLQTSHLFGGLLAEEAAGEVEEALVELPDQEHELFYPFQLRRDAGDGICHSFGLLKKGIVTGFRTCQQGQ